MTAPTTSLHHGAARRRPRLPRVHSVGLGVAAGALTVVFLLAVSSLVSRLS